MLDKKLRAAAVGHHHWDRGRERFFDALFPVMLGILLVFRLGIFASCDHLKRAFGFVILACYAGYLVLSYLVPAAD